MLRRFLAHMPSTSSGADAVRHPSALVLIALAATPRGA